MSSALRLFLILALLGCDGPPDPVDASTDGRGCGSRAFGALRWSHASLGVTVGASRDAYVELAYDCERDVELTLRASEEGVVDAPATVHITEGRARAELRVTGVAEGLITLTASALHGPSGDAVSADIEIAVTGMELDACAGSAEGQVAAGGELAVSEGTLKGAALRIPAGAARPDRYHVDDFAGRIECADAIPLEGYRALGPAVRFGPEHLRFARDVPMTIPVRLALLPSGAHRGHVEVAYRPPHHPDGRIVPIASPRFSGSAGGGWMTFEAPRLGTYQAVVREDVPERRSREIMFRGILGFSMGGSGSGYVGFRNPELFDFVAPLGGPTDWSYMLEQVRRYHLGGFCTAAERNDPSEECDRASLDRVPAPTQLHEHAQHFEHWWYDDANGGQGGTFRRKDYIAILRDLTAMFGNPNHDAHADPAEPNVATPGVPESIRTLPDAARCHPDNQITIETGFYDDEYNPDGSLPVITFCDGAETDDIGQWNPHGVQQVPIEVVAAVDLNDNGVRDPGEPIIRNGREPFEDIGLDGVANEAEVSPDGTPYHPVENPDPAGDDFDFQYNPRGTENNWMRDTIDGDPCRPGAPGAAEPFEDVGLDGVPNTLQLAGGGYDNGEDNGCFDLARGARRMLESSPRSLALQMDEATLRDVDLFADGGIRDLFNWVVMANITMAGWSGRGLPVRFYNSHAALHMEGRAPGDFDFEHVDWDEVGRYAMVRYGDPDVDEDLLQQGDGGHVGTLNQLSNRLYAALAMMSARWPDGDHQRVTDDRLCTALSASCPYVNSFTIDFTASTGRTGPATVILPPGYFAEENAQTRYPVVYFLHGYGMEPSDLAALGVLMWQAMNNPRVSSERRLQKMILIFPDGRCRNDECLRGTFYADAPESRPNGARMETFLLDLMEHVDAEYRTRSPEVFEVVD